MPLDLAKKRIVVTGGAGFLGRPLCEALAARGAGDVFVPRSRDYDLRTQADVARLFEEKRPEVVIHLAAREGGIGESRAHPGGVFYDGAMMGMLLIEEARRRGIERFVCVGGASSFPKFAPVPLHEEDLWNGYPDETGAADGIAKRMLLAHLAAYRAEYAFPGLFLILANLYGPGDRFDSSASHVIPALIGRFLRAKAAGEDFVTAWGTGNATREFLFVRDAAEGILRAAESYDGTDPVNIGSGEEISIRNLARKIARLSGFAGEIRWDPTRPDGQPRRVFETRRAREAFGWTSRTSLDEGLAETILWARERLA